MSTKDRLIVVLFFAALAAIFVLNVFVKAADGTGVNLRIAKWLIEIPSGWLVAVAVGAIAFVLLGKRK
ncbi:MAG TPA: hypothetical protein VGD42_10800 [Lysobacter sp.]